RQCDSSHGSLKLVDSILRGLFFFFQAEDGIRHWSVTGVQTCALPIYARIRRHSAGGVVHGVAQLLSRARPPERVDRRRVRVRDQIGRASCRERVEISVGGGSLEKTYGVGSPVQRSV